MNKLQAKKENIPKRTHPISIILGYLHLAIKLVQENKLVTLVIIFYLLIAFSQLDWGIPNNNHPFSYHMDEWAQDHSLRTTFKNGTPHVWGGGNGVYFFYVISGIFLAPFVLLHIVNPFVIKSSILFLDQQHRLFEVLRLQSIFYAILSIATISYIARKYLKASSILAACFFTITPVFLAVTVFYRYDSPVIFWTLLSLLFFYRYKEKPTKKYFLISGIIAALTAAIKISALPLLFVYIGSYFFFTPLWKKNISLLLTGIIVFIVTFLLTAIPDAIISIKAFTNWFYYSAILVPQYNSNNILFGMPYRLFYLLFNYPAIFGHIFYIIFILCILGWIAIVIRSIFRRNRISNQINEQFLFFSFFIFVLSIQSLKIDGIGNRLLIMLPFFGLISSLMLQKYINVLKNNPIRIVCIIVLIAVIIFQTVESLSWVSTKIYAEPRETSSDWIKNNLPEGSQISLENIPIFQDVPDIILKDYYTKEYFPHYKTKYTYQIIDSKSEYFGPIVILTNAEIEKKYLNKSEKRDILQKLDKQGYKKIISFTPNFSFFRLFNNDDYYYLSRITASPQIISIFKKESK